jgi:dienelactone hydrolase
MHQLKPFPTRQKPRRLPIALLLSVTLIGLWQTAFASEQIARECTLAANAWLGALDAEQRGLAQWPFDEKKRRTWGFLNNNSAVYVRNEGLALEKMGDGQRALAHELIRCALSSQGYQKAASVIRVAAMHRLLNDPTLKALRENRPGMPSVQIGPTWYWLAVFGDPSAELPWQLQLEGHHLALNFTFVAEKISATPHFMGARPALVESEDFAGWSVLSHEKRRAFRLLESLTDAQRKRAVVSTEVPEDIFTNPLTYKRVEPRQGLSAADMSQMQRRLLMDLIGEFTGNLDVQLERQMAADIEADGLAELYFSWRGPTEDPAAAVYFLIHGPSILIEFDNAWNRGEDVSDPNHIHSIMRVPGDDFGDDLLAEHYRTARHHQPRQSPGMVFNEGEDISDLGQPYRISRPDEVALEAMASDGRVVVNDDNDWISFQPQGRQPIGGFIFYPGSEVAPAAYARPMRQIAEQGYLVVVTYMPRYMAITRINKAAEVIEAFPQIRDWSIGGHSLGGTAAAMFVAKNSNKVNGLAFWDSYPMADLKIPADEVDIAFIYRVDESGEAPQSFRDAMPLLPEHTRHTPISGATHMQFGNAIKASHRPAEFPTADWEDVQQAAVQATLALLESNIRDVQAQGE